LVRCPDDFEIPKGVGAVLAELHVVVGSRVISGSIIASIEIMSSPITTISVLSPAESVVTFIAVSPGREIYPNQPVATILHAFE
jgi:biotin carboxyl carrier protein